MGGEAGTLQVYWLGLGIDPLTLVTDMLTVVVVDSAVFDNTFSSLVTVNEEGQIVANTDSQGVTVGLASTRRRLSNSAPINPCSRQEPPCYAAHGNIAENSS
jgi:hypothetical protein